MSRIMLSHIKTTTTPPVDEGKPIVYFVYPNGDKKTFYLGDKVYGGKHEGKRPIGLEWYEDQPKPTLTKEHISWILYELSLTFHPKSDMNSLIQGLMNE